jgi:hypothetical protein
MRALTRPGFAALVLLLAARPVQGQVPLFVAGMAGAAFDAGQASPSSGGGFAYLAQLGVRLGHLLPGAEFARYQMGGGRSARFLGVFARLPATTTGPARPYFVVGLGDYRYSPHSSGKARAFGGNAGLGVSFPVAGNRAGLMLEARFHSAFDGVGSISAREFASVEAGVHLGF